MEEQVKLNYKPKITHLYLVKCPNCGNQMQALTYKQFPQGVIKKCVYCPKNFNIHKNVNDSQIIKQIK